MRRTETEAPADPVAAALAAGAGGPPFAAPLAGSAALLVSGPDAATFLHGQLANDVTGLSEGATNRSLLLNHKGHAMAEAQVLRLARESFLVVVDDGLVDWVEATLVRHVVFDEVTLARVAAAAVTVQGERAGAALGAALAALAGPDPSASGAGEPAAGEGAPVPPAEGAFRALDTADGHAYAYAARRSLAGGYDVLAPTPAVADALMGALAAAGAVGVDAAGVDAARVAAGVPAAGREGGEGVLPQEAGLARFVSFRKGCYLGQEIMARIEARGAVRRGLRGLELEGEPAGAEVAADGRVIGRLGTVARLPGGAVRALAVVRNDVEDGAAVSAGGVPARLVPAAPGRMPA
ncbi:MAG TPA: hypothetical protein VKY42_08955 [Trueperaceae bacterium]|nr:hypothetical protein [Trueperaceae bacterium]